MNVTELEPVGARVEEMSIADAGAEDITRLRGLLGEHGVLALPAQSAGDDEFVAFLEHFGELTFTEGETAVEGFPDLNVVSNVGRTSPPKSNFHTDTSYVRVPPALTSLRAVQIPESGGETLFTNQYRAYETLPQDLRERLDGRTMTHRVTGVDPGPDAETEADHPIFHRHPITGRTAIYMSTPARCVAISGLPDEEAERIVTRLFEHSTAAENTLRHAWSSGDVVIWDNGCVLHRADHSDVSGDRVMHRGMVAGEGPLVAA